MKIIQLKWSDEAGWKDWAILKSLKHSDEDVLEVLQARWRASRKTHRIKYDAEFRIIELLRGTHFAEHIYTDELAQQDANLVQILLDLVKR